MQLVRHRHDRGVSGVYLSPLPPGVRAETFTYADGKHQTVYLAPYESDGPRLTRENGERVLYFMFAAYVFRWPDGSCKLDVGHGSIDDHMELWQGIPIAGRWHPDGLVRFAQNWAHEQFRKFAR